MRSPSLSELRYCGWSYDPYGKLSGIGGIRKKEQEREHRSLQVPSTSLENKKLLSNKIIKVIWQRGRVADQWRFAEGAWIPKEENSRKIEQFKSIFLLSTESKIFFSILLWRLSKFLLKNNYIDTSVQIGKIPGFLGCLEHIGVITQILRKAREGRSDLAVLWLDLTNAYGNIPCKLVEEALKRHHVLGKINILILGYYDNFQIRISSRIIIYDWHRLKRGIITGCTLSATIFTLAINMIVKLAKIECWGPLMKMGVCQPPIRAYMDNLTVKLHRLWGAGGSYTALKNW